MKVVILAGGRGSRLGETTDLIPKPMVRVGELPIISHIMNIYRRYGFDDFIIAGGYLYERLADYFEHHLTVRVVDTGLETQTGGRLARLKPYLTETFMFTYGDGLANVNISHLLRFHERHGGACTVTAVRPPARFGRIHMRKDGMVTEFNEKRQSDEGFINGGFFVCEPEVLYLVKDDETAWEGQPMRMLARSKSLYAYEHDGFWQCMDTQRDVDTLNQMWKDGKPWLA